MKTKLDELYDQRRELQRQLHIMDSQIEEGKQIQEKRTYENLYNCYKKAFLKDIEIFNSKKDIQRVIKFGLELNTPHYNIYFKDDRSYWQAEITDLHKNNCFVSVSLYKEQIKTIKQSLDDIADTIIEYEFEHKFNGVG